jgi:hypothetical protein
VQLLVDDRLGERRIGRRVTRRDRQPAGADPFDQPAEAAVAPRELGRGEGGVEGRRLGALHRGGQSSNRATGSGTAR